MSEHELNSYRFLSGQEPSDEMLQSIMTEARNVAIRKAQEAQKKYEAEYELQYLQALSEWGPRINVSHNG